MASIAGIISQHAKLDIDSTEQLRKMLRLMRHRGSDNSVVGTL
jgi:asparagine synthetase B (glutamine-hydrolysing)